MQRGRRQEPFSEAEVATVQPLMPHLRRTLGMRAVLIIPLHINPSLQAGVLDTRYFMGFSPDSGGACVCWAKGWVFYWSLMQKLWSDRGRSDHSFCLSLLLSLLQYKSARLNTVRTGVRPRNAAGQAQVKPNRSSGRSGNNQTIKHSNNQTPSYLAKNPAMKKLTGLVLLFISLQLTAQQAATKIMAGPMIGHTDLRSTVIWAQVSGSPATFSLKLKPAGKTVFIQRSIDPVNEQYIVKFMVGGLEPGTYYNYDILGMTSSVMAG
jgi:hypothetical protein